MGITTLVVNRVFIALLSELLLGKLGLRLKGSAHGNGDRTALLAWWLTWGDPASTIVGMRNLIAWGSQGFGCYVRGDLGELVGKHHGWFSDGIRFPSPLIMPSLVAFPDQAPYTT